MVNSRWIEAPGVLGTYRSDFEDHWKGNNFRHTAENIDMSPPLYFSPVHGSTVQDTMAALLGLIQSGKDFVSIGDGVQSQGTFSVGGSTPTIESCFTAALANVGTAYYGGIILLKSGFYNFSSTVTIPSGICIIGESGGTIINATTDHPIFDITQCPTYTINRAHNIPPTVGVDGYQITRISNLSFFDNYALNAAVLVTGATSCFIKLEQGSNVEIDKCSFFGKYSGPGSSTTMTRQAIYLNSVGSSYNTILSIKNSVILSTQKALTFACDSTKYNKLTFSNNRCLCSGIIGSLVAADRNIVNFNGCDASFCNNDIKFGVGPSGDANQSVDSFIYCAADPTYLSSLIVTGNTIKTTQNPPEASSHNNLIVFAGAGLNFKNIIFGNSTPDINNSNTWYLVVGDGYSTVGDINGTRALSYIYTYYKQENNVADVNESNFHEQITIFVKSGYYLIDGTSFTTTATNFAFQLIGLPHDGNLPRIKLSITSPAVGGQPIYLGAHIENISFEADGSYLYFITIMDTFMRVDVPIARQMYVKDIIVKNCYFYNVGIKQAINNSASLSGEVEGVIRIEQCFFSMQSTFSNATVPIQAFAMYFGLANYKLIVKNCGTKGDFYGNFLCSAPAATAYNNDIIVENCSVNYKGYGSIIVIINCRNIILRENNFSLSNFVAGGSAQAYAISLANDTLGIPSVTLQQKTAYALIQGNRFVGYDTNSEFLVAYSIQGFSDLDIVDNVLSACPLGFFIDPSTNDASIYPYNINIKSNMFIASSNSYGFCSIVPLTTDPATYYGTVNILNNNIDMTSKGDTSNRMASLIGYYPTDSGSYLFGVISVLRGSL